MDESQIIDERDAAEQCLSQMYYLVIGHSPEWSNLFGHAQALEDVEDALSTFKQTIKREQESERKYLPTLPDLVDRLTIVQQKMIFIPERAKEYAEERELILHDIDLVLHDGHQMTAKAILAVALVQLTNRVIWENESVARKGGDGQDKLLKFTHSINGVRNTAKNMLAAEMGGRHDYKIDCFAAEFGNSFGNWDVFGID